MHQQKRASIDGNIPDAHNFCQPLCFCVIAESLAFAADSGLTIVPANNSSAHAASQLHRRMTYREIGQPIERGIELHVPKKHVPHD